MVLRTATKDENVPRPRTLISVVAKNKDAAVLWRKSVCAFRTRRDRAFNRSLGRRRGHFHGPDGGGTHVHGGAVVAGDVPGFGGAEPVAFGFVGGVVDALGGFVGFVLHSFA